MLQHRVIRLWSWCLGFAALAPAGTAAAWIANGTPVCTALTNQSDRQVVPDGTGGVIVIWIDPRDAGTTGQDLYAQRLDAAGTPQWLSNGVVVCNALTNQAVFKAISDGVGGVIVVWVDTRNSGTTGADLYTQRLDSAGAPQWTSNGVVVCNAPTNQVDFEVVGDGMNGVVVVWIDSRDAGTTGADVYARRVDAAGVAQWTSNGVALCTALTNQVDIRVVSDGAGGAIVAWIDTRDLGTTGADLYARRVSVAGTPLWTANGVVVCNALTNQGDHTLISDGASGAIVTWVDVRDAGTTGADLYARRVDAAGVPQWTANGVPICTAPTNQTNYLALPDAASGVVVVWLDPRDAGTTGVDIYARRVNAAGTALWASNGVVLCNALTNQTDLEAVSDGAGGAIAVWTDTRDFGTTGADVYARRVDVNGTPLWTANGVALCAAPTNQHDHKTVTDGFGGAMVFWGDTRDFGTTGSDLYGQHVDASGSVLCVANGVAMCQALTNQSDFVVTASGPGGAIVAWHEQRDLGTTGADIYAQRLCGCTVGATTCAVPVQISDLQAVPGRGCVDLVWQVGGETGTVAVFRGEPGGGGLAQLSRDLEARAGTRMQYRDETVAAGIEYEYAIGIRTEAGLVWSAPVRAASLAFGSAIDLRVVPAAGPGRSVQLEFALPAAATIRLDLFAVDGRRVRTLVDGLRPAGTGSVSVGDETLAAGLYFAALRTPWGEIQRRVIWVR